MTDYCASLDVALGKLSDEPDDAGISISRNVGG